MAEASQKQFSYVIEGLCYALALMGVVGTQVQLTRMPMDNFIDGTRQFWVDVISRPASLFLTVDILVLSAVVFVWMFSEARRLNMRLVWIYYLGSLFIGISFFVPVFMAMRQRQMRRREDVLDAPLSMTDCLAVGMAVLFGAAATAYSLYTIF